MVRQQFSALAMVLSFGVMAPSAVQAETALPRTEAMAVPYVNSAVFPAASASSTAQEAFAGPYQLLAAGTPNHNSFGMILASMGLMALIAYRRRMLP